MRQAVDRGTRQIVRSGTKCRAGHSVVGWPQGPVLLGAVTSIKGAAVGGDLVAMTDLPRPGSSPALC